MISIDAAAGCSALGSCDWLDGYQRRIVAQLAGGAEITPGLTLLHRASVSERDAARTFILAELAASGSPPNGSTTRVGTPPART